MNTLEERFWNKVVKTDCCWEWTAHKIRGYGRIRINGIMQLAHRVSWQLQHGIITPGMKVLHRCDNPSCVNPSHLFLGTQADNIYDMISKGRRVKATGEKNGRATHPERTARGGNNGNSKLTIDQVIEIRSRVGETQRSLAKEFGVSKTHISRIVTRKFWKDPASTPEYAGHTSADNSR